MTFESFIYFNIFFQIASTTSSKLVQANQFDRIQSSIESIVKA